MSEHAVLIIWQPHVLLPLVSYHSTVLTPRVLIYSMVGNHFLDLGKNVSI